VLLVICMDAARCGPRRRTSPPRAVLRTAGAAERDERGQIVRLPAGAGVDELARTLADLVTGREPAQLAR
jgi:hypothetical protein